MNKLSRAPTAKTLALPGEANDGPRLNITLTSIPETQLTNLAPAFKLKENTTPQTVLPDQNEIIEADETSPQMDHKERELSHKRSFKDNAPLDVEAGVTTDKGPLTQPGIDLKLASHDVEGGSRNMSHRNQNPRQPKKPRQVKIPSPTSEVHVKTQDGGGFSVLSTHNRMAIADDGVLRNDKYEDDKHKPQPLAGKKPKVPPRKIPLPGEPAKKSKSSQYESNYISTTKYSLATFLPLGLLYQFYRFSNIYFLFVTVLQCIPIVSPLHPITAVVPMVFVLTVSMIREGVEDFFRYRDDEKQNSAPVLKFIGSPSSKLGDMHQQAFEQIKSADIKVGDVLKICDGMTFPCDLAIISSSADGSCFIKTSSLDGEKNLKKRHQPKDFDDYCGNQDKNLEPKKFQLASLKGHCYVANPDKNLHKFDAYFQMNGPKGQTQFNLDENQLLLKGAQLANTDWVVGLVVYTGKETKIMQNLTAGIIKMSHLERQINKLVGMLVIVQCVLCIIMALCTSSWFKRNMWDDHFQTPALYDYSDKTMSVVSFFTYFLLLHTFLPISLQVTIEITKVIQARFIEADGYMVSFAKDFNAIDNDPSRAEEDAYKLVSCKSASLVEEIGQINYIFSDKTGTLTRNVMEFKYMLVDGEFYGDEVKFRAGASAMRDMEDINEAMPPEEQNTLTTNAVLWACSNYDAVVNGTKDQERDFKVAGGKPLKKQSEIVQEFMKVLCLAHGCVAETFVDSAGEIRRFYNGPSPDEVALVEYAAYMDYVCAESNDNEVRAAIPSQTKGQKLFYGSATSQMEVDPQTGRGRDGATSFEVIRRMNFTSDRKRMSILVRDPLDGQVKLLVKGADSIIQERLANPALPEKTQDFLKTASTQGLRTLLMATKVVSEREVQQFLDQCNEAGLDLENKEQLLDQVYSDFEEGFTLLGATAVEDRLQDGVPKTIYDLQHAGIKIWMLTGDKLETAENIGESCQLLKPRDVMDRYSISTADEVASFCNTEMVRKNEKRVKAGRLQGILVEAKALPIILSNDKYKRNFVKISKTCEAVIVCRVSPSQKADVVRLIKEDDTETITLSIGDGANDVSMIREAHIGVGLYGNEGRQAVNSSDFALGEFKMLWRLLLVHGRLYYLRNAEMILYFFYKNCVVTMAHFYFAFSNGMSGQTIYDDFYISYYNLLYTSFPCFIKALFEQDINFTMDGQELRRFYPQMYYMGAQKTIYNWSNYIILQGQALIDSLFVYFIPVRVFQESHILNKTGINADLWTVSLTSFTGVFIAVTIRISAWTRWWTCTNFLFYSLFTIGVYIGYIWFSEAFDLTLVDFVQATHSSGAFWLLALFFTMLHVVLQLIYETLRLNYSKNASDWVRIFVSNQRNHKDFEEVDENGNGGIQVADEDYDDFEDFMAPIRQHWKNWELLREKQLDDERKKRS